MGIDVHALKFLRYARTHRNFGKSITIGRQRLYADERLVGSAISAGSDYKNDGYCEQLLVSHFCATSVDSIDNSGYENASIIHDMNLRLPSELWRVYDTVIDGGCLEHIYNVPQALENCSLCCKPGGQILHILPANNFCGHGFWQFSPELFFSLYSDQNGYQDTEVFLADLKNTSKWFRVKAPTDGRRVNTISSAEVYVLVRTVLRNTGRFSHNNVQQSDYVFGWTHCSGTTAPPKVERQTIRKAIRQSPLLFSLLAPAFHFYLRQRTKVNRFNPGLSEIDIGSLLT